MECLNIDYHIKRLLIIAMAKFRTREQQAKALGLSSRTLINYFRRYNINYRKNERKASKETKGDGSNVLSSPTS